MTEPGLQERVATLEGRAETFAERIAALERRIGTFERRVDARFEAVDRRFAALERRTDGHVESVDGRLGTRRHRSQRRSSAPRKASKYFHRLIALQAITVVSAVGLLAAALLLG